MSGRSTTGVPVLLLLGAALVAIVGASVGSPWATGVGGVVVLGVLAVHSAVTEPAMPRSTRLLLWGGLLLLAVAGVVELWGWAATPFDDTPPRASELIALVSDPVRQRTQFLRSSAVAGLLVVAQVCLAVAIARLPGDRLRQVVRAGPIMVLPTLVTLVFVAFLPAGLAALLGSFTNVAVTVLLVLGGCVWVVARAVRRHGTATFAAVGVTIMATVAWLAVDLAWRSRPEPRDSDTFLEPGVHVGVAVQTGSGPALDFEAAGAVALLLLGAALTVLACARLSTADHQTR